MRFACVAVATIGLCWCASLRAGELAPSSITSISIEHGCNGCPEASLLVLNGDGTAELTTPGNARFGTATRTLRGSIDAKRFGALAALGISQGFFSMNESYEDPTLRDGAWTVTSMAGPGVAKRVTSREDAAPDALKTFEAAIEAARSAIDFRP